MSKLSAIGKYRSGTTKVLEIFSVQWEYLLIPDLSMHFKMHDNFYL